MGGRWRGLTLAELGKGDPCRSLRPTTDRVRESIFNILAHGLAENPVPDANVLDLFAGSGALGLEALSRGALRATFVENGRSANKLLAENIRRAAAEGVSKQLTLDAVRLPINRREPASLVFLDPPYGRDLGSKALSNVLASGWIASGAVVVWEEDTAQNAPKGFELLDHRQFGNTTVTFLIADQSQVG